MASLEPRRPLLKAWLGLSLLLHLNLALLIAALVAHSPDGCKASDLTLSPFEVAYVSEEPVEQDLERELREELEKEKEEEEKKEKDFKGQVVDLPRPKEEKPPDKARFLSEYDSKVARETKGPPVPFKEGKITADRPVPRKEAAPPPTPREREAIERKAMKLAMRAPPELPRSELEPDDLGEEPSSPAERSRERAPPGPRAEETRPSEPPRRRLTMQDLQLSDAELARAVGSPVNDYLKDVEEGEQTLLNSKRWRFATFFNRVKRQVAQNWHPELEYRRRDPSGNVYGFRDRLTILRVRLTPEGRLKDLHLERPSGVGFLDDEAIAAFRAAQPFPNPPKGLIDEETGLISFRFGFFFEISRKPSFRVFRYDD